jgi:hypothetical protein
LGRLTRPASFLLEFAANGRTIFSPAEAADNPDFASKMTVRQRMYHLLRHGAQSPQFISVSIDASVDTIDRTRRRYGHEFTLLEGGLIGLTASGL